MAITPLPSAPSTSDPANFDAEADAFVAALGTFVTETNALAVDVEGFKDDAETAVSAAEAAQAAAEAAASAALWVSGTTYVAGDVVYSPANYQTYRRISGGGGTTDPSADSANWTKISAGGQPRILSVASDTSPFTWNSSQYDMYVITAQAEALTMNADSGTPFNGQRVLIRIKDDATPRALTWTTGSSKAFRAIGFTLPTTTVASKELYVGCIYNSTADRWDVIAVARES
jgi:hypothetical protein